MPRMIPFFKKKRKMILAGVSNEALFLFASLDLLLDDDVLCCELFGTLRAVSRARSR